MPFDLHALVQLLGQAHGLLGGKIEVLGRLLLQRAGGEGDGRFFYSLPLLYVLHPVGSSFQLSQNSVQLLFAADRHFLRASSVKLGRQGSLLPLTFQFRIQAPILLRDEGVDLILPVADHAERYGLYPACA